MKNITIGGDSFDIVENEGVLWEYSFSYNGETTRVHYHAEQKDYMPVTATTEPGTNGFPGSIPGTLTYAGSNNPKNAEGEYDYSLRPLSLADYAGMVHDKAYDLIPGAEGPASDLLDNPRKDYKFNLKGDEMNVTSGNIYQFYNDSFIPLFNREMKNRIQNLPPYFKKK